MKSVAILHKTQHKFNLMKVYQRTEKPHDACESLEKPREFFVS